MYKKDGYAAMLGLLIVLAIVLLLYFLNMGAIFGPGRQYVQRPIQPEDHPWRMEDLLVPENQIVPIPRKGQPELLEAVIIAAAVHRNNTQRGTVNITFGKDCRVTAAWDTQYESDKKNYSLQSQMKGNVVPSKVYSDNMSGREDKTRLFFIAKGPYTQITRTADNLSQTEEGTAYILGWLRPDNTAEGTITITTDQSWSAAYPFTTMTFDDATKK